MGLTPYQRLVRRLERPLFIAPLFLIVLVVLYDRSTGQDMAGFQYVWFPWILQGVLVLTAFNPFALGEDGNSIQLHWLAGWLYPLGFGAYFYAWQYLPSRDIAYVLYIAGWIGGYLLSQYRRKYIFARMRGLRAEQAEMLERLRHRRNQSDDDPDPLGSIGV